MVRWGCYVGVSETSWRIGVQVEELEMSECAVLAATSSNWFDCPSVMGVTWLHISHRKGDLSSHFWVQGATDLESWGAER